MYFVIRAHNIFLQNTKKTQQVLQNKFERENLEFD